MASKKKDPKPYQFIVILDEEDEQALRELSDAEKLTMSDTVRRLIRSQHRKLQRQTATG